MPDPLVETKLLLPRPRREVVPRPRLAELLQRGADARSRWSRRPPGSGRRRCWPPGSPRAGPGPEDGAPVAWVSLEERDRRATSFWTYVLLPSTGAVPGAGARALTLLQSGQAPMETVLAGVVNELERARRSRSRLVLDDYHLADGVEVADGMTFLVEHLPPQLRLVISTRADPALPLARLRARGELVEIRAADLRFTVDEVAAYLNERRRARISPPPTSRRSRAAPRAGSPRCSWRRCRCAGPRRRRRLHRRASPATTGTSSTTSSRRCSAGSPTTYAASCSTPRSSTG